MKPRITTLMQIALIQSNLLSVKYIPYPNSFANYLHNPLQNPWEDLFRFFLVVIGLFILLGVMLLFYRYNSRNYSKIQRLGFWKHIKIGICCRGLIFLIPLVLGFIYLGPVNLNLTLDPTGILPKIERVLWISILGVSFFVTLLIIFFNSFVTHDIEQSLVWTKNEKKILKFCFVWPVKIFIEIFFNFSILKMVFWYRKGNDVFPLSFWGTIRIIPSPEQIKSWLEEDLTSFLKITNLSPELKKKLLLWFDESLSTLSQTYANKGHVIGTNNTLSCLDKQTTDLKMEAISNHQQNWGAYFYESLNHYLNPWAENSQWMQGWTVVVFGIVIVVFVIPVFWKKLFMSREEIQVLIDSHRQVSQVQNLQLQETIHMLSISTIRQISSLNRHLHLNNQRLNSYQQNINTIFASLNRHRHDIDNQANRFDTYQRGLEDYFELDNRLDVFYRDRSNNLWQNFNHHRHYTAIHHDQVNENLNELREVIVETQRHLEIINQTQTEFLETLIQILQPY